MVLSGCGGFALTEKKEALPPSATPAPTMASPNAEVPAKWDRHRMASIHRKACSWTLHPAHLSSQIVGMPGERDGNGRIVNAEL